MTRLDDYKDVLRLGGPKAVADMLNTVDADIRQKWILLIAMEDSALAAEIKELMCCFEDLAKISDRDMQTLIRSIDFDDILISLKLTTNELRVKFLANLSSSQRKNFESDFKTQPKHKKTHIAEVQKKILVIAKKLEEDGKINLRPDDGRMIE